MAGENKFDVLQAVAEQQKTAINLILGTLAIMAIYLLVNLAYLYLVPLPEMAEARLVAATAAERIPALGGMGARLIAAVVMISTFSSVNGTMMASPRIFFGMADRGLFFRGIARVSPRFQSPSTAIFLATAATLKVGAQLVTPQPDRGLGEILLVSLADWFRVFVGIVLPFLAIASVIEIYLTPVLIKLAFPYL